MNLDHHAQPFFRNPGRTCLAKWLGAVAKLAVRRVVTVRGRLYPHGMAVAPDGNSTGLADLTPREREILRRTSLGQTNAQVAGELGVSVHAVNFHLGSIFRKLRVRNRTEAASVFHRDTPG